MYESLSIDRELTLLDLLDRILDKGDITLSVADVDLVYLGLRLRLTSSSRQPDV